MFLIFIGVIIEMNTVTNFLVGSNASVTCRSDIDATKMEWLNSKSEVIASVAGQNNLTLMFNQYMMPITVKSTSAESQEMMEWEKRTLQ